MKTLIIDGNNLVHRVYWVANNQVDVENSFLHVFMFLNAIKSYAEKYKPDKIYCCWDEKQDNTVNERKEMFADYKGNRDKDYGVKVHAKNNSIKSLLESLGIKNFFPKYLEADDCMAFLAKKLPGEKIIVTVDKDLCQCVNQHVKVFDPIKKIEINHINFNDIMKCSHHHFMIEKCFKGDKSDNVPSVTGMGKKKIEKFFNGEYKPTVEQNAEFKRNYELFRLDKYEFHLDELEFYNQQLQLEQDHDFKQFKTYCEEMQLQNILNNVSKWYNVFCFDKDYTSSITKLFT
jgi:5'-3' exonuclease